MVMEGEPANPANYFENQTCRQPIAAREKFNELLSKFGDAADEADPITCLQAAKIQIKRLDAMNALAEVE